MACVKKNDSSNSIVWTLNNGWIFFRDQCFLKYVFQEYK